jgi:N utilization substance protein B
MLRAETKSRARALQLLYAWEMQVERNILRLGILELRRGQVPPKVAIDEAVRLAHWFGGARAPGFVNGVLDGIARTLGRL